MQNAEGWMEAMCGRGAAPMCGAKRLRCVEFSWLSLRKALLCEIFENLKTQVGSSPQCEMTLGGFYTAYLFWESFVKK